MGLTKISGKVIKDNCVISGVVTASTFTGPLTGNVSAPTSLNVGVTTFHSTQGFIHNLNSTGVITATSFSGDGSNLSGIDATQIQTGNTSVQTVDTGSDGHVKINTEGTERVRIHSSGNVGIGTDNPDAKFHVHGGTVRTTNIAKTNFTELGSDGNIEIKRTGGGAYIDFANSTSDDYDVRIQEVSDGLTFTTGGQGSASEKLRILSAGGITFNGDTAAANALDDYEEGTCTISFVYYSSPNWYGVSFSTTPNTTAYYRKVGGIVTLIYYTSTTSISGGAGSTARIDGLPFVAASSHYGVVKFTHNTLFTTTVNGGYVLPGTTSLYPLTDDTTSAPVYASGTTYMMMTVTYFTDQ